MLSTRGQLARPDWEIAAPAGDNSVRQSAAFCRFGDPMFAAARFRQAGFLGLGLLLLRAVEAAEPPAPRYTGSWPIKEWTPEETGGRPQSFSIVQDPVTGLIYSGNEVGVLEYDGVRWRHLPLPVGAPADGVISRGLEFDDDGRLWVAAENEVLIYSADAGGQWRPVSLRTLQPDAALTEIVWELRQGGRFMWGATTTGILCIDRRTLQSRPWPMGGRAGILGTIGESVWFQINGNRLMHTRAGEIEPAPVPELPAGVRALGVTQTPGGVLQVEHTGGVLELRDARWTSLSLDLERILAGAASRVRRRPDGGRIFNTRARTLILTDAAGRIQGEVSEPAGVNFGVTPATFLDRDGGFWMANASGIRRLQLDGAAVRHGAAQGLRGGLRRMSFDGPSLVAATAQGLFVRDPVTGIFAFQSGSPSDSQALWPSPAGGWLVAAGRGFGEWRNGAILAAAPGAPEMGLALATDPRDPARVFVSYFNGVTVHRRSAAGWTREGTIKGMGVSIYFAACDEAGALWLTSSFRPGVWRATPATAGWPAAELQRMDEGRGEPMASASWKVAAVAGEALVFGEAGIWHEEQLGGRLVPDTRFAGLPQGAATPLAGLRAGGLPGILYIAGAGRLRDRFWRGTRERADAKWIFTEILVPELKGQVRFEDMCESPDGGSLWLGGADSAFAVDLAASPAEFRPPAARWRGVRFLGATSWLYAGAAPRAAVSLPRGERAVALEFSAPDLRVGTNGFTGIEYRTRAGGVDRDWTAWTANAARELTNVPPGDLKLEVQARNLLGEPGPVAALVLVVPPFWWETWWARSVVLLAGVVLVASSVRLLVKRQFRQRIALLEAHAAVQQERLRIARDMHDDLGSTLASIVHLSDRLAAPGPGPETALARIHEATRELVHRTRDIVWAATPQHDSVESLVEQLAAHAERTLGDRGVGVKVELPAQLPEEEVGSAARHDLFLAFKEAVNNAAKYAQARTARLRVELTASELVVTLADDGIGFAPGEVRGTGHGLGNLQARLAAHGGRAEVSSTVGRGTTVTIRLPRTPAGSWGRRLSMTRSGQAADRS
jgi:signal transduction histidine kinase